jgi:hypothetical protein
MQNSNWVVHDHSLHSVDQCLKPTRDRSNRYLLSGISEACPCKWLMDNNPCNLKLCYNGILHKGQPLECKSWMYVGI